MRGWVGDVGGWLLVLVCVQVVLGTLLGEPPRWLRVLGRALARLAARALPGRGDDVAPSRRPVEQIGADVRRLHGAFHRDGMRFAKYEGCRLAYDAVLAEAADTLEIDHLLAVLRPGAERDLERERVERLLEQSGLSLRPRAA